MMRIMKWHYAVPAIVLAALIALAYSWFHSANRTSVPFRDLSESLQCIPPEMFANQEFVIRTEQEYDQLLEAGKRYCKGVAFPAIDFSQDILLGKYTMLGGCDVRFEKELIKDDRRKVLVNAITAHRSSSACQVLIASLNWVAVTNAPVGYRVEFQVK